MIIESKNCMPSHLRLYNNHHKPLDVDVKKITINIEPNEIITADMTVIVREMNMLQVDLHHLVGDCDCPDLSQSVINEWYIRDHFRYFLNK